MTTNTDIELPPLPLEAQNAADWDGRESCDLYDVSQMTAYARAAIELDRQQRGPVIDHEISQTVNSIRDIAIEFRDAQQLRERIASVVVPLLKRSPQPAAPAVKESLTVAEPVKALPELIVTKGGIPFEDQNEGIRQFKEACMAAADLAAKRAAASTEPVKVPSHIYPPMPDQSKWTLREEITSSTPIDHEGGPDGNEARYIITAAQLDRLDQIESALLARYGAAQPAASAEPIELRGIAEALENGDGFWRSCSGCHELNEGHDTGPYSEALKCHLGGGCSECGGIGAIWDTTDYQAMADEMADPVAAQPRPTVSAGMVDRAEAVLRRARGSSFTRQVKDAIEAALDVAHPTNKDL